MSRPGSLHSNARLFLPELAKLSVSFETGNEFPVSNETEISKQTGLGLTLKPKLTPGFMMLSDQAARSMI